MPTNITQHLQDELSAEGAEQAKALARALIEKAKEGNASIAKLIFDRIDDRQIDNDEVLTEEEVVERVTAILDRARQRRDHKAVRKTTERNRDRT